MKRFVLAIAVLSLAWPSAYAAPAKTAAKSTSPAKPAAKSAAKPAAAAPPAAAPAGEVGHAPAPTPEKTATKKVGEGELGDVTIKGERKDKMQVGKLDPPAAFNLEDIQNFPEDRLQPVLNNPITFEEGRDFSHLMDFRDDQPMHPWLTELPKAPFLEMKTPPTEKIRDWKFSIIDQAGATVSEQTGKGAPPDQMLWSGEDTKRDFVAVDTVYIPQLATTDKEGYHHTFMGQPVQFSAVVYADKGKTVIELSSKKLFLEKKPEFTKEARLLLDKVCDVIRQTSHLPFAIQPYENDDDLGRQRQQALVKFFTAKLSIPENQIVSSAPAAPEKRGSAMAIISNSTPGGSES